MVDADSTKFVTGSEIIEEYRNILHIHTSKFSVYFTYEKWIIACNNRVNVVEVCNIELCSASYQLNAMKNNFLFCLCFFFPWRW